MTGGGMGYGQMAGAFSSGVGGLLGAFSPGPSYSTVNLVKNPTIQGKINTGLTDWSSNRSSSNQALGDFISAYLGNKPQAQQYAGQETQAIGQFYSGDMATQLAQLRAQREQAINAAANVATQQAIGALNRGMVTGQGAGPSSYDTRMAMAALTPIRTQAALDTANQARADLGYLTQNQLALIGQRQNLANQMAAYGLYPEQIRQQMYNQQLAQLGTLTGLDQANNFYGVKATPSTMDRWSAAMIAGGNALQGLPQQAPYWQQTPFSSGSLPSYAGMNAAGGYSPYSLNPNFGQPITSGMSYSLSPTSTYAFGQPITSGMSYDLPLATSSTFGAPITPPSVGYQAATPSAWNLGNYGNAGIGAPITASMGWP